jgi:hypothetical protein
MSVMSIIASPNKLWDGINKKREPKTKPPLSTNKPKTLKTFHCL